MSAAHWETGHLGGAACQEALKQACVAEAEEEEEEEDEGMFGGIRGGLSSLGEPAGGLAGPEDHPGGGQVQMDVLLLQADESKMMSHQFFMGLTQERQQDQAWAGAYYWVCGNQEMALQYALKCMIKYYIKEMV
ncbi:hypothetical protein FQN51_003490 [Onygenales sp. PD_10]|nr:hypothetical protein FQN51_003490 [Onygenales sp. PD_10]